MVLKVIIRDYKENDWPEVKNLILIAKNFGTPFLEEEKRRISLCKTFPEFVKVFIAEIPTTKEIVGYSTIEIRWRSLVIMSIITHHNYLRKGIGKQIMDKIIEIGERLPEINVVRVDAGDFMNYAQQFYLSYGFQISGFVSHDLSWFNHQVHFAYPLKGVEKKVGFRERG